MSPQECLLPKMKKKSLNINDNVNSITTYNHRQFLEHTGLYYYHLSQGTYLGKSFGSQQINQHYNKHKVELPKGIFKCNKPRGLCWKEISHWSREFTSFNTRETYTIGHHFTCQSDYVVYLIECHCCLPNRTHHITIT